MKRICMTILAASLAFCTGVFANQSVPEIGTTGPKILAECVNAKCERTGNMLSVPLGAEIEFFVEDSRGIETVKWKMGDGSEQSRLGFQYSFTAPGKYEVLVIVYYSGEACWKATAGLTVHVIAAPPAPGGATAISWLERVLTALAGVLLGYFGR